MTKLFILAFLLMVVQGIFSYFQIKDYQQAIKKIRKYGNVSAGTEKKILTQGRILLLACDNNGIITKAMILRGVTVFERFKFSDEYTGMSIYELEEKENAKQEKRRNKNKLTAEQLALQGLLNRFRNEEEDECEMNLVTN